MSWVGRRLPRLEDPALLTGQGRFVADRAEGALAMAFVRSPLAAGTLTEIEVPPIEAPDSFVFTAADLAGVGAIEAILNRPDYKRVPQPILARNRVVFAGQPVAIALARSRAAAEDLAEQVFADIEPDEPILTFADALADGARAVHPEAPGNVLVEGQLRGEGVDAAFEGAAAIVDVELRSERQSAMPLEARGGVAAFDAGSGRVTLYASVQMPHMLRTGLADVLGIPESDLRVVAPDVGGGFGQKMSLFPEYVALVWAARHLKRNVAWIEDRRENFLGASHARDQRFRAKAAFDSDGRILALDADLLSNVGAFSCYPVTCGVEPLMAFAELPGPYRIAHYAVRSRGVTTNTAMMAPYRGVSRPMLTLTMEQLMDRAARQLGLDPLDIRRRNLICEFPHTSPTGLVHDAGSYVEAMDAAARVADLEDFRQRQTRARAAGRYLGVGVSVFSERSGYGTPAFAARMMEIVPGYETVDCEMDPSGRVTLAIGASPHGQGLKTALAQLAADRLGVTPEDVRVVSGDTDATPYGWGTFASRSMVIAGGASQMASDKVADKLRIAAAQVLECAPDDIELGDGLAKVQGANRTMRIAEIARALHHKSHLFADLTAGLKEQAFYDPAGTFSNACHIAEVEVEPATGGVRVDRFIVVEDAGRLINPLIADGQIAGGVAQGIANALYEELVYDEHGTLLTTSLADYAVPTAFEIPPIDIHHMETISPATVTKAKGLGEGGTIGAPAAVIGAINDALTPFAVAINTMPATPDRVWQALRDARDKAA